MTDIETKDLIMIDYDKEGLKSAKACARSYGIKDAGEIALMAKQFAYDLRKHAELKALAA